MSKIRVLPDSLANKIAAGEVVERPASIVKELIENSIDAGARSIEVTIETGGRRLIRVSDDGEGMTRDDAIIAFERHATSKIKSAEDLEMILTLGFRGEALASIASVSKVRLRTQIDGDLTGTEIEISGGRLLNVRDTAFSRGAEFEIRDLFFNVPARRKFLRSESTENFHIASMITHYALANPDLSFRLINNSRETIHVSTAADLRERAYQLFGEEFIGDLIEVAGESGEMRVRGYVSSPSAGRKSRDSQYFFINGRYVRDKVLNSALNEAYRAMIPSGVYPTAMLFVELPPHEIDVNVHPAKTEVRFVRGTIVHDMVRDAIRASISRARAAVTPFSDQRPQSVVESLVEPVRPTARPAQTFSKTDIDSGFTLPRPVLPEQGKIGLGPQPSAPPPISKDEKAAAFAQAEIQSDETIERIDAELSESPVYGRRIGCLGARAVDSGSMLRPAQNLTLSADEINPLGQLHNSFIIAADRSGLLLIDQHVAHERILFEQHWAALRRRKVEAQRLLLPETIDLTPAQAAAIDQLLPELENNGFEIGRLSGRTISVQTIPALLSAEASRSLLLELIDAIEVDRRGLTLDELRAEIAASLACRAAVKINMPLTQEKILWMIDELLRMDNPATCPHGRPIILRITMREIEKGFQR
ncbi:MAG: DNA mismatch repair endonuclease MutL [Blastocatellales bacterium]